MGRLAAVIGSSLLEAEPPHGDWEVVQRHGGPDGYVLPHRIDHEAELRALRDAGCDRVLAIGSVGGLRPELGPGTLLCPDDFIALQVGATAGSGREAHRVAGFDPGWRAEVLAAAAAAGAEVRDGGVYWQSVGPRLETAAEIRLIAAHADVVGMTLASECVIAVDLGLRYAALCAVDNLANGVGGEALSLGEVERARAAHRAALVSLLAEVLPRLGGEG